MVAAGALNIVFFGTPAFAVPSLRALLGSRHHVAAVVTQPDRPRGRGHRTSDSPVKQAAVAAGVDVMQPERLKDPGFRSALTDLHTDIGIVAAYGKILPEWVVNAPRLGMINVHASLLPRYRGAAPVHRAIMAGEHVTGVTIMRIVQALDAGPMLSRRERRIGPDETSEEIERDLAQIGAELLVAAIEDLAAGRAREEPQDESASTYAPRLTKGDGIIDWKRPARDVHNQVRGLHPWPHAYSYLNGERLIIRRTMIPPAERVAEPPGTVVEAHGAILSVAAGGGSILQITEIQAEGSRPMTTREFLAGHPVRRRQRFASS